MRVSAAVDYADRSNWWRVAYGVALVFLMVTTAFMQFSLGVLAPFLTDEFSLSRTQVGMLSTTLFIVASAGSPFTGRLIDAVGARRVLVLPFVITAVAFLLFGAAPTYAVLLVAIAVAGGAMAFGNPLSNKLIALHVTRGRQGPLMGVKQSGVQVGAFLAGILLPAGALALGWRGVAFVVSGLVAASLLYTMWLVPSDPSAGTTRVHGGTPAQAPWTLVVWIGSYALLMGAGLAALYAYLPLYAVEDLGMSVTRAGAVSSLIGLIGVASRVIWGLVSERVRHPSIPLAVLALSAFGAQLLIWLSQAAGSWLLWVAAVLFGASAVAWNAVAYLAVVKELGTAAAGRSSGVVQLGFFVGFAIGPTTFGVIADAGGYGAGWATVAASFACAALVAGAWVWQHRKAQSSS